MTTFLPEPKNPLISAKQLHSLRDNKNLVILDATKLKAVSGAPEIKASAYIPTAQRFDFAKAFSDTRSPFSNTMPSDVQFSESARALGINNTSLLVIYDARGVYSSPRAWWMFRAMGHENAYVLNGGVQAWLNQGYKLVESLPQNKKWGDFNATFQENFVYSANKVLKAIDSPTKTIIDARSAKRFQALIPEPREGVRSGHIPSSRNIPFEELLKDEKFLSNEDLVAYFSKKNIHSKQKLISSCGSGLTACIILLAAYQIGFRKLAVYDASWSEWGADPDLPIEC